MPDSFVQLPPDSTGKSLDTRTAPDGNHREVVVLGSPTLADVFEGDASNGLDVDVTRVQGTVAVSNAGLSALAGAISGTEVQVDIVSGGGSGTQYTEDDAAPANPIGTALAMVRDDALSGQTTADGDIVAARATDKGELYVKHVDAMPVTDNGGVLTVDGTVTVGSSALPTGAATSALQLPNSHDVTVDNGAGAAAVNIQDGGNVITVDGTVGVSGSVDTELPAAAALADNTANPTAPAVGAFLMGFDGTNWDRLQTGAAATGSLKVDGSAVTQPVSAATLPLPTGASSLAEQQTQTTALAAIETAVELIDNAISGSELQVDVVAALPAGSNNIGDVDIASLPNEGQQSMANSISVAIASDQSTVPVSLAAGGTTQYAEDTAHVTGDQVTLAGVVQQTADAALSSDGDRSLLQVDASGFLKVNIKAGAGSGGTAMADDAIFTPATTQGTPAFGLADETAPDSVDEGDAGALRMTLDRKLLTRVVGATDANRLDIDASGHAQVDIAAASVTVPVSAASLPLPTGASTSALQTQPGVDIGDVTVNNAAGASAVNIQDGGNSLTVDGTVAVTGVSTLAEQQTQTGHLATIAGDTTDIEAAVELLDDTVKTFGTDTYTEATTKGLTIGAIRRDADTSLVDTTNEVAPLQVDALGRLKVEAFSGETLPVSAASLPLPTGASTLTEQQSQTTHLATIAGDTTAIETAVQIMDDWDESDRAKVNPIAGQAGVQGASGTVTALTQRVVLATDVGLPAGTANIGDVDVLTLPALVAGTANIGDVDVLTLPALVAGTANIGDVDIASVAAGTVIETVGDVAADAAVPANPVATGGRASTAVPTAVSADGDSVYNWLNRLGMQVVSAIPGAGLNADPYTLLSETAQYTTTQTSTVLVAGGASERIVVTSIQIQVGGSTNGTVQVYFGTGAYSRGTDEAIFDGEFAVSATLKPGFFAAPPAGFRAGALGDDILVTTSAAINPLTITVWYYLLGV